MPIAGRGAAPHAADRAATRWAGAPGYFGAVALVALALAVALGLQHLGILRSAVPALILAVIATAVRFGLGPALLACLTSTLSYDFFFLPPIHSFTVNAREDAVALGFYAIVALVTSSLAARVRGQAIAATRRAEMTEGLYRLSRRLASAAEPQDIAAAATQEISALLGVDIEIVPHGEMPPSAPRPATGAFHVPMRTDRTHLGYIVVCHADNAGALDAERRRLLTMLVDQTTLALERAQFAAQAETARVAAEADRLRGALLASLSHDLRTPLTAILGCAETLVADRDDTLDRPTRVSLCATIQEEAQRLNRFVANVLDMTRLEAGSLRPQSVVSDLSDAIAPAVSRSRAITAAHRLDIRIASNLPALPLDPVLLEHVIFNLLDNAAKYSAPGTTISLRATGTEGGVTIELSDQGIGLPPEDLERIFDKFYRVPGAPGAPAGSGLGLAICRGFVEAMGGHITAANRQDCRGAVFMVRLPILRTFTRTPAMPAGVSRAVRLPCFAAG